MQAARNAEYLRSVRVLFAREALAARTEWHYLSRLGHTTIATQFRRTMRAALHTCRTLKNNR
jgi:hypothetical protein